MTNTNNDVIERLKKNPNEVLLELYKNYRTEFISWSIKNFGATEPDALDCFQDAIIIFYRNVIDDKISTLSSSEKTYLFAIGKNFLKRKFSKNKKEVTLEDIDPTTIVVEQMELYSGTGREVSIADIVQKMRDPCKSILRFFYFRGFTMEEIAAEMNYKNAQTVKAQKVRCIKEIQNLVRQDARNRM